MNRRLVPKTGLLIALVGAGALIAGGAASASGDVAKGTVTVEHVIIKQKPNGRPYFDVRGDGTVNAGDEIKIVNRTSPRQIGPHTFSLVKGNLIPRTRNQMRKCFRRDHICREIAKWHQVDFQTGQAAEPDVEAGAPGWDTEGDLDNTGDSHLFEHKDEATSRTVTATPGETLTFMCAIHPEMHGRITVNP